MQVASIAIKQFHLTVLHSVGRSALRFFSATINKHDHAKSMDDTIKLDQFLKLQGMTQTGGQAKLLIQSGEVRVNGQVEMRRGRKLVKGDRVTTLGETFVV